MTTFFSPTALPFGNVTTGVSTSQSVTVTNTEDAPVTLSVSGTGFAISPTTVPKADHGHRGSVVVTVAFKPTEVTSYAGAIIGSPGSTCDLTGTGVVDPSQFLSESAPDPNAGDKYLLLSVPTFTEQTLDANTQAVLGGSITNAVDAKGNKGAQLTPLTGNAFLWLGTNPGMDETGETAALFAKGMSLARLVGDPMAIAISENLAVSSDGTLSGNVDNPGGSMLVTDMTSPSTKQEPYTQVQTSSTDDAQLTTFAGAEFADGFVDGNPPTEGTPWAGSAFGTAQDPDFLIGYADDTRWRGAPETSQEQTIKDTSSSLATNNNLLSPQQTLISGQPVDNVNANRMAETLKLLTKGGWWDHSDGNHISTTMGDKLEVVQGNYKLVILGRQPVPPPPPLTNTVNLQWCIPQNPSLLADLTTWYGLWVAQFSNGTPVQANDANNGSSSSQYGFSAVLGDATSLLTKTTGQGWAAQYAGKAGVLASDLVQKFAYQVQVWLLTQNTFLTDVSGGHFQEQYPSPTPCIKTIEFSQDNNGEWTLYQDNAQGNLVTRLKGRTVDLFQGPSRETYVGTSSTTALYAAGGATGTNTGDLRLDPMIASYTWAQSVYSQTGSETKPIGNGPASNMPNAQSTSGSGPQPTISPGGLPVAGASMVSKGDVVSKTWADRVATYVGSYAQSVGYVYSETHANFFEGQIMAGTITNTNTAATITNTNTAATIQNVNAFGNTTNVNAGVNTVNVTTGMVESFVWGPSWTFGTESWKFWTAKQQITASDTDIANVRSLIANLDTGVRDLASDIVNVDNRVTATSNVIANETVRIDALSHTSVGLELSMLLVEIELGL
jgi:hypothetical protein